MRLPWKNSSRFFEKSHYSPSFQTHPLMWTISLKDKAARINKILVVCHSGMQVSRSSQQPATAGGMHEVWWTLASRTRLQASAKSAQAISGWTNFDPMDGECQTKYSGVELRERIRDTLRFTLASRKCGILFDFAQQPHERFFDRNNRSCWETILF